MYWFGDVETRTHADAPGKQRPSAVAGKFYPSDPTQLRQMVEKFLAQVDQIDSSSPKAIIVPHAGYPFSGPIAASAFAQFCPARDTIKRIVLIGPSHWMRFRGVALPTADGFLTPLGPVILDREAIPLILPLPQVSLSDEAHVYEHSLEVQLPFLQVILSDFRIVPLLAGDASPEEVSEIVDRLWGGPETRFVVSSDLSHYHDYNSARRLDQRTAAAIEQLNSEALGDAQACGCVPVRGLLAAARRHHLSCRTIDLRNSGDTAGPRDQVVGYGAFIFTQN